MSLQREQTLGTIKRAISMVGKISPEAVLEESPVTGIPNVDSIVLLEIVTRVELELDIDLDEESLFNIRTVREFVDTCHNLLEN